MNRSPFRLILVVLVLAGTIVVDQLTKEYARQDLAGRETVFVAGNFFLLHYAENEGAFLGMGSNFPFWLRNLVFIAFPLVMLAGLLVFLFRRQGAGFGLLLGLSLVTGGGVSNLVDRLVYHGRVTDFMNMGIGGLRTGIFNAADVFIMLGLGVILIAEIFAPRPPAPGTGPKPAA